MPGDRPIFIDNEIIVQELQRICTEPGAGPCPNCKSCTTVKRGCWEECVKCIASRVISRQGSGCPSIAQSVVKDCLDPDILRNIDWLLHLSQKRYRDHAAHQLFVGALGSLLLRCKLASAPSTTLKEWIAAKQSWTAEEVDTAWWIASLMHDHAYPLSHMLQVTPALTKQGCKQKLLGRTWALLRPDTDVAKVLYQLELLTKLEEIAKDPKPTNRRRRLGDLLEGALAPAFGSGKISSSKKRESCYDHGMLGATNLAVLLAESGCANSVLNAAIRAIAVHNAPACHPIVDAGKDPIAFLLILCDELQEWGRRIVVQDEVYYESNRIELLGITMGSNAGFVLGDGLAVTFEYPNPVILERTEWNYSKFSGSKKTALGRLQVPDWFPIKRVDYHVHIPHGMQFGRPKSR